MKPLVLVFSLSMALLTACAEPPPTPEELETAARETAAKYRERVERQHAVYLEIARAAAAVPAKELPPIDLGSRPKLPNSRTDSDRADIDLKFLMDPGIDPFRAPDFLCLGGTSWYGLPVR